MNIDTQIEKLLTREGGYVNNPADRGGETNFGITERVARSFGYDGSMRNLTKSIAKSIYIKDYWTSPRFDKIYLISPLIAEELLDTGVNCGVPFTKPLLQRALNLLNNQGTNGWVDLEPDGIYGNKTLIALKTYLNKRGKEGEVVLLRILNIFQGYRYIEITERRPTQEQFFYGWIANRIVI